ncbi:hypothetical protein E1B28_002893 [Marasmius oreades]|uniref:DUF6534 domain-containing protein n=1 Tax=Marasmius oreades TaxID=181124 RepID=A0A9P7RL81_9AGAR|nr:uncharacterized protein E1B28_002893 [Marasmius oreades]KAG7085326.1 hypothetical protein E1B28_002893 [Marasmius oreades]
MSALPVSVTIDNTLGAVLVGFAVSCCIYGILFSQVFTYFSNYPEDRVVYKFLVVLLLCMETADQVMIGHILYFYGITNYANILVLLKAETTWSIILQQTIGAIVGAIVKTNFTLRVWRFSERNVYITSIVMVLVLSQLGLSLAFTVEAFKLPTIFAAVKIRTLGSIALGAGVLTDIAIAVSLCYFLNRLRTGYQQSDTLVSSLVRYAINTGAVTGAVSLTTLILYNLMPTNLVFAATYFILSKFYAISFMATLNTRRIVRGKGTDRQVTSNNTNLFHLGTRVSAVVGPRTDLEDGWESAYTLTSSQAQMSGQTKSLTSPSSSSSPYSYSRPYSHGLFPQNSYHPGTDTFAPQSLTYGQAL